MSDFDSPIYEPCVDPKAQCPPEPSSENDKDRLRLACTLATQLYPGPPGELIYSELCAWSEFGYRFGGTLIQRLVDHLILKAERKKPADA